MPFLCTADARRVEFVRSGDRATAICPVGYDRVGRDLNFFIQAELLPGGGGLEYRFWLTQVDGQTKQRHAHWNSGVVAGFIGAEDRRRILGVLCAISRSLIVQVAPATFYMTTLEPDLPDRALAKYRTLLALFGECGYKIAEAAPYHGLRLWWLDR
jgi:hypothetical protein